ncbi:MAG: RidA family protein [Bdellovibrionota bacterium]
MHKREVATKDAPQAIGPYSQAIQMRNTLFCSGQIPVDPSTGKIVGEDITAQTEQAMKNLLAVLKEAGLSTNHVVKTTIFLKDMDDFAKVNEIYAKFFERPFPARSTVQVAKLPLDVKVEIEAIANV